MLKRIGLGRPELVAWATYDWANSAFVTIVITAVFPPFFKKVAADGLEPATATAYYAYATTFALALVALLAPILGALADRAPLKKRLLGGFMVLGVIATTLMALIERGDWGFALAVFIVANIGVSGSFVFYDALLPHIAGEDEVDQVSTAGYALGYLGGGLLLAAVLLFVQKPELLGFENSGPVVKLAFVATALWWLLFSIPLFRRVPEPTVLRPRVEGSLLGATARELASTFAELRRYKQATLMLVAFLIYNDGIQTIIRMATVFGSEKGLPQSVLIGAILMVQFAGIPFTIVFGQLARKVGARPSILVGLLVYTIVAVLSYRMETSTDFFLLAFLVAVVQGACQALSRSMFASMIPKHKSSEFFGLFAVFEKFAGIFGPLLFGLAVAVGGSSQSAILSVILFFIVGGVLLARVDVEAGQAAAKAATSEIRNG